MHIPQHFKPNDNYAADSVAHFKQAISILIQETSQVSNSFASFTHLQLRDLKIIFYVQKLFQKISWQKTRAGIASYDASFAAIRTKGNFIETTLKQVSETIDLMTTNGDFSSDIMARARQLQDL